MKKHTGSKMPAGRYYVGDLCYVFADEQWDEVCNLMFLDNDPHGKYGTFTLKDGTTFTVFPTKWGDGSYISSVGTEHAVDSGTIGCVLESSLQRPYDPALAALFDMESEFDAECTDGVMFFGDICINTAGNDDEDDEEEEYDDEEE